MPQQLEKLIVYTVIEVTLVFGSRIRIQGSITPKEERKVYSKKAARHTSNLRDNKVDGTPFV
jgi:hypothetical protein